MKKILSSIMILSIIIFGFIALESCDYKDSGDLNDSSESLCPADYRFCDMGDGTVKDNDSGLIWLKDAHEMGIANWSDAMSMVAALNHNEHGLTDGSSEGDWRLPSLAEWTEFFDTSYNSPAICNSSGTAQLSNGDPFFYVDDLSNQNYWTNFYNLMTDDAFYVDLRDGSSSSWSSTMTCKVWPVRSDN